MKIDLKIRNEKLIQQKKELEETQKYKDSFFANMSHELRTPLNAINVLSSLMMKNKNGKFDEKEVKNLEIINDCGNKLANLINDILDISKIEAKEMIVESFLFDFDKFINKIVDMFLVQIEKKGLFFELKKDNKIGTIFNDEKLIGQIIIKGCSQHRSFRDT
jgi:signal transduction histidine kinase